MTIEEEFMEVRTDPLLWFESFSKVKDLVTQKPITPRAKPVQRRLFEYYKYCQERDIPCRTITVKGRRAGGSDGHAALMYLHAQNHQAECGQIGTDYRTSKGMLAKVKFFGDHDEFPGWTANGEKPAVKVQESSMPWYEYYDANSLESVPFDKRTTKTMASRIEWPHGSVIQLYSAQRPESARSAGLQCYHGTEFFRWPNGGAMDAGETLNAMNKTVPKRGFTWIGLEGTANGAQGSAYELTKSARWPENATWWHKWQGVWPQNVAAVGKEIQFVIIFAAWFEDPENQFECEPHEEKIIRDTLTEEERQLIFRYECDGPRGRRLGDEVETTTWNQLKWARACIEQECRSGGVSEFHQEFPADIQQAFRASGSPALDLEGLTVLEQVSRNSNPEYGDLTMTDSGVVTWHGCAKEQATIVRWEPPIKPAPNIPGSRGCKYLVGCDPASGADQVTNGAKDRTSVQVWRDAYTDQRGHFWPVKLVARIKPPCQWEKEVVTRFCYMLAQYYGAAAIVVESNIGADILKSLNNEYRARLVQREMFDTISQKTTKKLGWHATEPSKRIIISTLQRYVREQMMDCQCPHVIGELMTLVVDSKGHVRAGGSNFDDDAICCALSIESLPWAHEYPRVKPVDRFDPNRGMWRDV